MKRIRGIQQKKIKKIYKKNTTTTKLKKKDEKKEKYEISLEEKSEDETTNAHLNSKKNKKTTTKNTKTIKSKNSQNKNLLNKKLKKDNSKTKKKNQNKIKKLEENKIVEKNNSKNKMKKKDNKQKEEKEEKEKKKKKKKISLEEIKMKKINDYKINDSLLISNHNIIEDCCLVCNEKNIFRAIKTDDLQLFKKCLNDTDKISSLNFKLQILGGLTPMEYIIKNKNKKLYTELVNFNKNEKKTSRVSLPKDKLSFISSGKRNIYTFGFKTRPISLSRGNKLGNNAFIYSSKNDDFSTGYERIIHQFIDYSEEPETALFHDDEDFLNFITFAKNQELNNNRINNLLEENIYKGNISIVEYLMSVFTGKEIYNYNKLHQLVTVQKPGAEKKLDIKNQMSVNKNNNMKVTPVHLACINPNEKILEELLKKGGETEFQDNMGRRPISYASTCKGPGPLKILINKKCNVNDRDMAGFTPIIHACRTGRYENVKLLLENGADPMLKPKPGQCMAIHFACMKDTENNLKILNLLLENKPELINITGSGRKSPLHFAVLYNCPKIVEFLVKKGAKINKSDKYTRTPLLLSCKYGYSQITKYLIECGADFEKCDNSKNSPLHYACAFGNIDCVKILLESGADINSLNMWQYMPIEIALLKNHIGIVNYLIKNDKFSVDTHFGNGNSFLLYYLLDIDESTFEKIRYILEDKKGNVNITNNNKMNAFHFLTCFTYRAYLSKFIPIEKKAELNEENHKKIYHPQYINFLKKYIIFLKEKGCEPDLQNIIGQTPLMLALKTKNFEIAQLLVEIFKKEIKIKHIDKNGFNIFDYAFKDGYSLTEECIQFIYTIFKIYGDDIDSKFLNEYTRYGRNSLLNLCEDYALHIYEKFYFMNKINALKYIRLEYQKYYNEYKLNIPLIYKNKIIEDSYKDFVLFITKKFYPLIEEFIIRGCDINCYTKEMKFKNNSKKKDKFKYYNNYGNIYPIMYLLSYPQSDELINLIKKYKININCTDCKNQTLFMYLSEEKEQIKNLSEDNYKKIYNYLLNNCNNAPDKNLLYKKMFYDKFEKGYRKSALEIFTKLGNIDINEPYYKGNITLFGKAVINSNKNEINFLLDNFKDLDINKINIKTKRNPLHYICIQNSTKREIDFSKFSKWIKLGVSITKKDYYGRNPLFYLFLDNKNNIKRGDPISSLSYLLDNCNRQKNNQDKLDLNDVDVFGNSLIFYAVEADAVFCVSSLLSKGVKIKNVKNYENNSIFAYALFGNSNSIPELFSKVNDVRVFEDKMYYKNKNPFTIKDNNEQNYSINEDKDEKEKKDINYCVEELFYSNKYNDNESEEDNKDKDKDDNLETLFEDNDEGTSYKILGNDNNDDFNDFWDIDNFNFLKKKENEDNIDTLIKDEHIKNSFEFQNYNLSRVNKDVYSFNYCNKISRLISDFIYNNFGDHNYHYQNNYIPKIENEERIQKFPEINSKKYRIYISEDNKTDIIEKDSNIIEEYNENKNEVLSESLFQYCIDKEKENIIYYILNQGYDAFQAINASLSSKKYKFCIVLFKRFDSIPPKNLRNKNSEGQTLIHVLCKNKNDKNNRENIKKIYSILTTRINIDINQFDNYMHTPLYYAVLNNNFILIDLLTDNMNENKYNLFLEKDKKNANNKSPLMLLYDKILNYSITSNELDILLDILFKVTKKLKIGYFNNVGKSLLYNYKKIEIVKKSFFSYDKDSSSYYNLNLNKIINIFEYLVNNCNIDINKDIDNKGNNIFFLCVIMNKYDLFNDILIKQKNIDYNRTNKEGKSLIHYIVSPNPFYSYQDTNFLQTAIKAGFNPNIKDKEGLTPLDYAKKNHFINMVKILSNKKEDIIEAEIKESNMDIDEELKDNINYNYIEVSDKYYNKIIEPFIKKNVTAKDKSKILVTKDCDLIVSNYHVYKDDNDILYNVHLSKVKINKYVYGEFLFYHMQLLVNDKRKMYNLITRWGRFGNDAQYQNTPFTDINEAIKEYNKIFLSKTGNKWEQIKLNKNDFERKPKKYILLNLTDKKPEIFNIINYFNLELKNIFINISKENFEKYEKNINPNTKELIHYLIKISFNQKIGNRDNCDTEGIYSILYFSKESLDKGFNILIKLAELNDRLLELKEERNNLKINEKNLEDENSPYNKNIREFHEISLKILDLSNTYYEIIPFQNKRNYSVTPINDTKIIKEELDRLYSYTYIEDTLKLFLSSLYYNTKLDPINYIYRALNKKIIPLNLDFYSDNNNDKNIAKVLINYIALTKDRGNITNIFEIIDENENILGYYNEKKILLFHGTETQNILGILSKGLLIAPIESKSSGSRFGSGIYLSDSFKKSLSYTSNSNKKYILMVDTLLDKVYKINKNNSFTSVKDLKKKGYNCLMNNSRRHISFENKVYLNNGIVVPTKMIEEEYDYYYDYDSEYVIYDPKLVNIKYIIEYS